MSLAKYIEEKNMWRTFGKNAKPAYNVKTLTEAERKELLDSIDADLSPENLCCDGEASPTYVRNRSAMLNKALKELNAFSVR